MPITVRAVVLVALVLAFPATAFAKTHALQPFPTNLETVPDVTQVTGLRVDLPKPDCLSFPSDCADVAVLNTLDGFNIQPRIAIPFSGPIDLRTVSSSNIFLVGPDRHVVGINQAVWEPLTNTLYVESDQQLGQATTYLLVVTRDVRDTKGKRVDGKLDDNEDNDEGDSDGRANEAYRKALGDALRAAGIQRDGVAAASLFTTQTITPISTKIRSQLHAAPVSFGAAGARTVFPMSSVAGIQWSKQLNANGTLEAPVFLPTPALFGVGTVAFGTYASPDYENADAVIPAVGTLTGTPAVQSTNQLQFTLFLPSGTAPSGGWPVAIFGHGFTDSKNGAPWAVAGTLASNGIASVAINVVGHGSGAAGTYTVLRTNAPPFVLPAGGRGVDQNHNGTIDSTEGVSAIGAQSLIGNRDGLRQTVVDLMQLVRELQAGIDVDGDGHPDLSTSRIYYAGQSFGGIYGTQLLGLEPDIRAGVPNVPGGPIIEIARLSPAFRPLVGLALITRTPSLYNNPAPDPRVTNFNENMPLRNQPLVVDTVAGASAIANLIDQTEWAQQAGNPAAYAPYITHPVLFQFARGDKTVPNPTTSAILRACGCAARATLFRNDLAHAAVGTNPNPHTFLTNITPGDPGQPFAFAAQQQIATFFTSDGATTIDPDGAAPFFETPASIVPEDLAFIP
jgi:Big-like domain-containing protein